MGALSNQAYFLLGITWFSLPPATAASEGSTNNNQENEQNNDKRKATTVTYTCAHKKAPP
ncbi:hypothetical protein J6TS1_24970 [Siminovitchia terrae]|uniref:Secreted protein n=1 Tax=Siminovitchia terrae TaxID=1914933 RepID=A0ABQ4KY75_SIMTE|nr:hypothetical protein J22TS1_33890 [Siminovitchia terrae]GIN96627.1 hypothetical protein J6TS1_24970 [Siminovitchia terrae]